MKNFAKFKKILLLGGDIAILYLSLYLALLIRYQENPTSELWQIHFLPFTPVFLLWIIIFYISNLYSLHTAVNNSKIFQLTNKSLITASLIALAYFYLTPGINITPKTNFFIYLIIFYIFFLLWRRLYNFFLKSYLPKKNIAFIGLNGLTKELIAEIFEKPHLGYIISFIISLKNEALEKLNGIPVVSGTTDLKDLILKNKISTIILTDDPHYSEQLSAVLFKLLPLKINYLSLTNFYELITGRIPINEINQQWFLENLSEGNKKSFDISKRIYDIILALIIFFISLIFWPFIALLIKINSRGPVFFTQMRAGKDGKNFKILKFRTMAVENNDLSPTKENDSRITKIGNFLRKTRIDEIPQVINILLGDMSFVGPRPERPEIIKELEEKIPFYRERSLAKPGLTGSDQISGEYHSPSYADSIKKLQYDLFYIKNRSFYLDFSILLKTIAIIFSRKGR
jgi:exopolysaccharide biosynthesis polyprenyl glycosylphosphotransferase